MGEDDAAAASGATANGTTTPLVGATSLTRVGAPTYALGNGNSGLGVLFNGLNTGYRVTSIIAGMNVTDNFGIALSVKSNGTVTNNAALFYIGNSAGSGYGLYRIGGNYVGIFGGIGFIGSTPVTSRWTRLALVRASGVTTLYVNGVAVQTSTVAPNAPSFAAQFGTAIGMRSQTPVTEYFDGVIDDVRAFTFAPSAFQITDLGGAPLTVSTSVNGTVESTTDGAPAGISCGSACRQVYPVGLTVELTATPVGGASFSGWSGACTGMGRCVVSMTEAKNVSASFSQIAQSLIFAPLADTTFASGPLTLSAFASSGLSVDIISLTPAVCVTNVIGSATVSVFTGVTGACTLLARQVGNASFSGAEVTQTFFVTAAGVASAPQNLACRAGVAQLQCSFDPPQRAGDSAVTGYTLSCQSEGGLSVAVSGSVSPLTLTGLATGVTLSCRVTATNTQGTSIASVATIMLRYPA
ncbi:MAG: hypothetical protein HC782_02260 [Gammaproteobacteria bacterium]|nr:hypothetical protein [Gammaproteobacteria bacterium]